MAAWLSLHLARSVLSAVVPSKSSSAHQSLSSFPDIVYRSVFQFYGTPFDAKVIAMKSEPGFLTLDPANENATCFILGSLEICANDHVLSRKLLSRLASAAGPMYAIIGERINADLLKAHDFSTAPPDGEDTGKRPVEILVSIVGEYLGTTQDAVVLCENWAAGRSDIAKWTWPPPRVACYGDNEVYHILTHKITDPELIEAAIIPRHHWQTGVCSSCVHVPNGDIPDERFLDEIVRNTRHLFLPAFDGSGYLFWSPT
jgi:hypothetical protein